MEKKLLREFIALFELLPQAELILSENTQWLSQKDDLDAQLEILEVNNRIEEIDFPKSQFLTALFGEVNDNLYKYPLNQREYIEDVLISFKELAPFIDEEEYYKDKDKDEEDVLALFHGRHSNYGATRKLFTRFAEDAERYSIDHYSNTEQYVINCYCLMYRFFSYLDARCVHFKLDLMKIQKEMNIYLNRRRYVDHLVDAGYAAKLNLLGITDEYEEVKALPEDNTQIKALPASPAPVEQKIDEFPVWFQPDNPGALAVLCKEIFDFKHRPKDYAIMTSLLLKNKFIDLHESHRRPFYESWYTFIGKPFPTNNNYHSINKHLDPYSFEFINDTDPDYKLLSRKFEKGLQGLKKDNLG